MEKSAVLVYILTNEDILCNQVPLLIEEEILFYIFTLKYCLAMPEIKGEVHITTTRTFRHRYQHTWQQFRGSDLEQVLAWDVVEAQEARLLL